MTKKVLGLGIALAVVVLFFGYQKLSKKTVTPRVQTAIAQRGTLIVSLSATGQVSTANSAQVTTAASGVVKQIFVKNGQQVNSGDQIAQIDLDMEGQQRNAQALGSYQSAQNSLHSLRSTLLTKWDSYMNKATVASDTNRQLASFISTSDDWLAAEAQYKNQQNSITQTYLTYLQSSPIIYAPISGTVTGLGLQIGSVITAQSNSSGGSTAQKIASVLTQATPTITISLTEIDVSKVKIGNKVTVTLDAFPGKTFAGEIISVDTVGSVSSGVTTYPAVIKLDTDAQNILTNMSAQAKIITDVKDNVLLIPTSAITNNTVKVIKNNQTKPVDVKLGLTSGTQTEIVSGLTEGDTVITNSTSTVTKSTGQTQSVFGSLGGGRVMGH